MFDTQTWQDAQTVAQQPPVVEEPQAAPQQEATNEAPAPTPEVHDEPGIPQQEEQQQANVEDAPLPPEAVSMPVDKIVDPVLTDQGEELPGDSGAENGDPTPGGYDGSGIAGGLNLDDSDDPFNVNWNPRDNSDMPEDRYSWDDQDDWGWDSDTSDTEVVPEEPNQGGYDGSGIAGGLDLDQNGVFDQIENNPDMSGKEEGYTYDEGAYEDAQDAMEDLQDALQDGDEEDLAEALEELQGYLGGFDKAGPEDEHDPDVDGDLDPSVVGEHDPDVEGDLDPSVVGEEDDGEGGINPADVNYQEVLDDLDSGNLDDVREFLEGLAGGNDAEEETHDAHDEAGNNPDGMSDSEGYTYDEHAYKDAEHAMKDLQHALKHGNEEDRADALEKLQGYLGGFDKGAEEEKQDGTETQDDQIPSDSKDAYGDGVYELFKDSDGDGIENYRDSDHYRDGNYDFEDSDGNGILDLYDDSDGDGILDVHEDSDGDPEKVPNTVDNKEPADAPDASGAAVSGPAVGAAGAAVGAGAAAGAGVVDQALDAAAEKAGGAIDDALGIEGSGEVLQNVANGNFDEALGTLTDSAGDWFGEKLGNEELGDTVGEALTHVANGDFEEALDTAVDVAGDALEGVVDDIGDKVEEIWDDITPW